MEKTKPFIIKGIKIAGVIGTGAIIVKMNKLFQNSDDEFENWLGTASDEELDDGYEERRLEWMKDTHGDITPEMSKINDEMVRRMNEKYKKSIQMQKYDIVNMAGIYLMMTNQIQICQTDSLSKTK